MSNPIADRTLQGLPEDPEIVCILPCGQKERFFLTGQTDEYYIWATQEIKRIEMKGDRDE